MFRTPSILPWLFPTLTWRIETASKELFLTFDDGPIAGPTEFVLDTLNQFNAKATFFCIGDNIKKHQDVFKRIVAEGHLIGNHTHNHLKGWNTSVEKYSSNIKECANQIRLVSPDAKVELFRPPYGRIKNSQVKAVQLNYKIIMWDVLTSDYSKSVSRERCLRGSIQATRPGSIIVFHDSLKAKRNMEYTLPRYLEHFVNLGYSFKVLNFD